MFFGSIVRLGVGLCLAVPLGLFGQVVLSEFQASNIGTLRDDDGDTSDWIEIANVSTVSVDLAGWYLTDDPDRLKKWQFPSTNLAGGQFLIVFASNKDHRVPGAPLHTNFKLSADGEYLALVKPDGVTLATAYAPAYPPQVDGLSYGLPLSSQTLTLFGAGITGKFFVPPDGSLGTNWVAPGFDDSAWRDARTGVGFDQNNSTVLVPVADSIADWSTSGVQGSRGWYYGYYNKSADPTSGYQTNDFVAFPRADVPYGTNNFWTGTQYWWPITTGYWDLIGQADVYPTGINNGAEHWVIRRWRSQTNGIVQARWRLYKTNPSGGGVTGQLYLNGILKDSASIAGADTTGVDRTVLLGQVRAGDLVDLALTPVGPDGSTDDGNDASANTLTLMTLEPMTNLVATDVAALMRGTNGSVYVRFPFMVQSLEDLAALTLRMRFNDGFVAYLNGVPVVSRNAPTGSPGGTQADSVADWSYTGQQGLHNWYYGFYNQGADADGVYDPSTDFNNTDLQWMWNGGAWVLGPGNPPWDMISVGGWQPNGTNSGGVHWAIRRWVSTTSGLVTCRIAFGKENAVCGTGATLRVLQNGLERLCATVAYNDTAGIQTNLVLNNVQEGDYLDFALDPRGVDGDPSDACDASTFSVVIDQAASPGAVWNSTATAVRSPQETATPEDIDLSRYRDLLITGTNVLAFHALNCSPGDGDFLVLPELSATYEGMNAGQQGYFTTPTPGAANGVGSLTVGPVVSEARHTPLVPADNDDLVVQARITPSLRPVQGVKLIYRVMYGGEVTVPMYDDGNHGDGAASDSVYGATIPASASGRGQMVRYYIVATDTNSVQMRAPLFYSATRSPQYFGTVVSDPSLTNSRLQVLHWFIQNPGSANSDYTARCSVFFNGEFYDNVGVNLHGQSTRGFPKMSYDFDFNPGNKLRWSDDAPRVGDLNLLTTWADKA
ncbi:MAG TPA: lamin tail domain-containing protein, partial [Verrucomicrobiae bacterium]